MGKICPTKYLSDKPTVDDKFGSHSRIAKSISRLVKNESGGKSIALKGNWGSGKSSIISMVEKNLDNDILLFKFNAWIHEGDSLRRSFLEKLIDFLIVHDSLSDNKYWKKEKKRLNAKKYTEKIEKSSTLTKEGKIFTLFSLLMPIGVGLISIVDFDSFLTSWLFWIGMGLAGSPFLCLIVLLVRYFFINKEDQHEKAFNFLSKEDDVTKNRTSVEIPEPSSIEFQKIFIKLLDEVRNNNKKLIVVMDNLDRINAKDALKMWSTMRTIFNLPHREKLEESLWLIVPFDENAIKELWENEKSKSQNIGKSFLEKTFQIEFNVSSPVLSDWRKYFIDNMELALPNHSSEEFHDLYKIFSLGRVQINHNKSISPREIKKIINKLGSLHRQWQNEIQLINMMLYVVLNEYQNWNPKNDLVNTKFIEKLEDLRLTNYITDDWQKELAALHLNVKKDKAIEMILEPRIDKIIKKSEYKEVEEISNTPGFTIILEDYLESLINEKENYSVEILKFTNIFSNINLNNSEMKSRIKKQIINYVEKSEEIKKLNTEISSGLIKLLNWKDNINFYHHVIKLISETLPEKEEDKIIEEKIDEWLKSVKILFELILDSKNGKEIANKFYFSGNENDFIKVTGQLDLNNYSEKLYKYFTPEIEMNSIIKTFNNDLKNKNFDLSYARAIKVINKVFPEFNGKSIVNNINKNLRNTKNNYNSDEYRTLLSH